MSTARESPRRGAKTIRDKEGVDVLSVSDVLTQMRDNPRANWTKDDIETACRQAGLICKNGTRGSHFKVRSDLISEILTIPARRPIKAVYIKQLLRLADRHLRTALEGR